MSERNHSGSDSASLQRLTEGQVLEELGLDRMELYLVAKAEKLGRYDPASHLLVFSEEEVEALAARLGVARRRRLEPATPTPLEKIPEPNGE